MDQLRKQAVKFEARSRECVCGQGRFQQTRQSFVCRRPEAGGENRNHCNQRRAQASQYPGGVRNVRREGSHHLATCDGAFYRDMEVVVVGGEDSACEEALFLTRFCSKVTLIHRRNELRASKIMADRTLAHEKITPLWDSAVQEVLPDEEGKAKGIRVKNLKTGNESEVPCKGVFIAIGHVPNTSAFEGIIPLDENGYFLSEPGSMVKTSVPGVFSWQATAPTMFTARQSRRRAWDANPRSRPSVGWPNSSRTNHAKFSWRQGNIASHLEELPSACPTKKPFFRPRPTAFPKNLFGLYQGVKTTASFLKSKGVGRGDKTLLFVRSGYELIVLAFAFFLGAVPIVIDPGMGLKSLLRCIRSTRPSHMVGIPLAHWVSRFFRKPFPSAAEFSSTQIHSSLQCSETTPEKNSFPWRALRMNSPPLSLPPAQPDRPKAFAT